MSKRTTFLVVLCGLLPSAIQAQVTSNSVTVTATKTTTLQPDQIVFGVRVDTPTTGTRDDALSALTGSGITLDNFTGVYSQTSYLSNGATAVNVLEWDFTLPVSISAMKSTQVLLTSVAAAAAKKNNGISISFSVQGTQVSAELLQSQQCALADPISSARTQAQTLANTANMTLSSILAMSAPVSGNSICTLTVKFSAFPY